jgi:eukaryotic-like serine/threonine-protein kinase
MTSGLAAGTIFAGRYRVVRPIAAGGMGAVYEVIHIETERRRALKVMLPHILHSEELRERFQREAKVAAHIDSEFIVDVFDAGYDAATQMPFLVMELLRGEELSKRLKRLGRLPPAEVVTFLHHTALALDKTHRANIIHRDLKPENLFVTEREDGPPRVKVLDFGIAKIVAESATSGATQSIGTPLYMAPEQFNPRVRLTPAADLYALGMVTYTLLAGAAYWAEEARGGNVFALATVVVQGPREPASHRATARGVMLPPSFDAWFARATAADPSHRFPTATEMIGALAQAFGLGAPGRAALTSLPGAESTPFMMGGPESPPKPPEISRGGLISGAAVAAAAVTAPPAAQITGPATTATGPVAAGRGKGIAIAVAVTLGALAGVGVYFGTRGSGGTGVPAPAAAASAGRVPDRAAALPAESVASPPSAPPVASVAPSVTPADVAAASASAPKAGAKPEPAAAPATKATASPAAAKKKYSRD